MMTVKRVYLKIKEETILGLRILKIHWHKDANKVTDLLKNVNRSFLKNASFLVKNTDESR
jgi:hypothetical protein